jgi:MoaA/NifB/PqqE/SkfB family radical SAM enzyme
MTQLVARTGHHLDWLKVQITRLCNFTCSFCSQADWASQETLDIDVLERSVLGRLDGLRLLIVTGGEPLARFDSLIELSRRCTARGTEVGVFSNLSLLTPEKAITLREAGVSWYRTTLNGATSAIHELTYPGRSYGKTMRGIEAAQSVGAPVKVRSTVCQANMHHLPELVEFAHAKGITEVDFRPYLPLGDCNPHNSFALGPNAMLESAAVILHLKQQWAGRVQIKLLPNWFDFLYRDLVGESVQSCEQCHCGRKYLYVDAIGNYRSCAGHRAILGTMFDKTIEEVWDSEGQLQDTRLYTQDSYCNVCPRRVECHGSNCHLINFEAHGRFDKVNPTCPSWNFAPHNALAGYESVRQAFSKTYASLVGGMPKAPKSVVWLTSSQA